MEFPRGGILDTIGIGIFVVTAAAAAAAAAAAGTMHQTTRRDPSMAIKAQIAIKLGLVAWHAWSLAHSAAGGNARGVVFNKLYLLASSFAIVALCLELKSKDVKPILDQLQKLYVTQGVLLLFAQALALSAVEWDEDPFTLILMEIAFTAFAFAPLVKAGRLPWAEA